MDIRRRSVRGRCACLRRMEARVLYFSCGGRVHPCSRHDGGRDPCFNRAFIVGFSSTIISRNTLFVQICRGNNPPAAATMAVSVQPPARRGRRGFMAAPGASRWIRPWRRSCRSGSSPTPHDRSAALDHRTALVGLHDGVVPSGVQPRPENVYPKAYPATLRAQKPQLQYN